MTQTSSHIVSALECGGACLPDTGVIRTCICLWMIVCQKITLITFGLSPVLVSISLRTDITQVEIWCFTCGRRVWWNILHKKVLRHALEHYCRNEQLRTNSTLASSGQARAWSDGFPNLDFRIPLHMASSTCDTSRCFHECGKKMYQVLSHK